MVKRAEARRANSSAPSLVVVSEKGEPSTSECAASCSLGKDLFIDQHVLSEYLRRPIEYLEVDLLVLAGAVAFADRSIRREGSWHRNLLLEVPVHCPEAWSRPNIQSLLAECLRFSTGDSWRFSFTPRKEREPILARQLSLPFKEALKGPVSVMPYSGGLDSFLGMRFQAEPLLLVCASTKGAIKRLFNTTLRGRKGIADALLIPIVFPTPNHPEQSFRARTFLFFSIATIAARMAGANKVVVPENGQGSLGPSLVLWGRQHPFQTTHPGFTFRLMRLIKGLWPSCNLSFEHPNIWLTKGEMFRQGFDADGAQGWGATVSCAFNPRWSKAAKAGPVHCGICGGCLLRRMALVSSGFPQFHDEEKYFWKDLTASTLEGSVDSEISATARPVSSADRRMGAAAVMDLASLSNLSVDALERGVFYLVEPLSSSEEEIRRSLQGLLFKHIDEWSMFVSTLGKHSWVARLAGVRV